MRDTKILSSYQGFALRHEEKCTENVVERMLKTNMELIKYENVNATARPMIFKNFGILWALS